MMVEDDVEGVCELVESLLSQQSRILQTHHDGGDYGADQLIEDGVQELLNTIQNHKFSFERRQECLREEKEKVRRELEEERSRLNGVLLRTQELERDKVTLLQAVEEKQQELANLKAKIDGLSENISKLTELKQLHYSISKITLDKAAKQNEIKGFLLNPRKDDVNTFFFNHNDPNVSEQFVRNYLWDMIAAGVNPVWDKI